MSTPGQEWRGIMPSDHPFQRYWAVVNTEPVNRADVNTDVNSDRKAYMRDCMRKKRAGK